MDLVDRKSFHVSNSFLLDHGGNLEEEAERLGVKINSLIDASASLVPFSLPRRLKHCLIETLQGADLKNYPNRNHSSLKEAIANHHQVSPDMVLPGNGASELITWAARDAASQGINLLPSPGFSDYKRALQCWNGNFVESPLPLKWESIFPHTFPLKRVGNVIWITNPHNPTGQSWSRNSLENLLLKYNLVICDEAFLPLVPNGEKESLIPLVKCYPNLIVIRSLTKLFSIAGLRLGYAISSSKRLKEWQECRDPWPLNALAIATGKAIMSEQNILQKQIKKVQGWVKEEGAWLHSNLKNFKGIISHPSSTNFQLIESNVSLIKFREDLARKNILLRDCQSFQGLGENWLRIGLQSKANNRRIVKAINEVIEYID